MGITSRLSQSITLSKMYSLADIIHLLLKYVEFIKLLIFGTVMLWKSYSELKIENLFHSISVSNVDSLASIKGFFHFFHTNDVV